MTPVTGIESDQIEKHWRDLKPLIKRALKFAGGLHSLEDVKADLVAGRKQVVKTSNPPCILVTNLFTDVDGIKVCNVFLVAGQLPLDWRDILLGIEGWAKSKGCRSIQMETPRWGWSRLLPGWSPVRVTYRKELWA